MELQFYNAPNKSLVFATGAEASLAVWTRVKALHAPWLVVIDREGKATGVLPAESLRNAMRYGAHGVVSQLPFKGAAVLPRNSRLSELLKALESPEIEAVLLMEGGQVHTVVTRHPGR